MKTKEDNRTFVESKVSATTTASDSAINASRSSMSEGVKATRNLTAQQSKVELEAAAASAPQPNFLNKILPKGAKAFYSMDGPA